MPVSPYQNAVLLESRTNQLFRSHVLEIGLLPFLGRPRRWRKEPFEECSSFLFLWLHWKPYRGLLCIMGSFHATQVKDNSTAAAFNFSIQEWIKIHTMWFICALHRKFCAKLSTLHGRIFSGTMLANIGNSFVPPWSITHPIPIEEKRPAKPASIDNMSSKSFTKVFEQWT